MVTILLPELQVLYRCLNCVQGMREASFPCLALFLSGARQVPLRLLIKDLVVSFDQTGPQTQTVGEMRVWPFTSLSQRGFFQKGLLQSGVSGPADNRFCHGTVARTIYPAIRNAAFPCAGRPPHSIPNRPSPLQAGWPLPHPSGSAACSPSAQVRHRLPDAWCWVADRSGKQHCVSPAEKTLCRQEACPDDGSWGRTRALNPPPAKGAPVSAPGASPLPGAHAGPTWLDPGPLVPSWCALLPPRRLTATRGHVLAWQSCLSAFSEARLVAVPPRPPTAFAPW